LIFSHAWAARWNPIRGQPAR